MFLKLLLQLLQSTLMKRSMTEFGSVLGRWVLLIKKWFHQGQFVVILGDEIIPAKSLQRNPILVASNNISINKKLTLSVSSLWQILSFKHILKVFHFTKKYPTKKTSVLWKQSFSLKRFQKIARKRVFFGTSF